MSQRRISLSADLKRLRDEGYELELRGPFLLLKSVPYVNASRQILHGTLVSDLTLNGDVTARPIDHVIRFIGEYPCDKEGKPLEKIRHQSGTQTLDTGLVIDHSFSSKPKEGYADYYEKMTTYTAILSTPAQAIDPAVTARTYPVVEPDEGESVFNYFDTASSRAGISAITRKLELPSVGIVGLGGTGSYVLDLVAKTPVGEIHLFDGDVFSNHNAFRSPGAPSIEELRARPKKVAYFAERYSKMHRHIIPHDCFITEETVELLRAMRFVFLCMDKGLEKGGIIERLEDWEIPFIDVGMGVELVDDALLGVLRVTSSTPGKRAHVREKKRIPLGGGDAENAYSQNIQIADLNSLNASLAVIKWKKMFGFYLDLEHEHNCAYTIDGNSLLNEDQECGAT